MNLPIALTLEPMEAEVAQKIPEGPEWQYEPKWDGFRSLCFRDGDAVEIMSKSGQPLARYFPEMVAALLALPAKRFVLDGELVILNQHSLDFDALLQRIHPAASRIRKLSVETPSTLIVFDLLADESGKNWAEHPLRERRPALDNFSHQNLSGQDHIRLSPATCEFAEARRWFYDLAGPLDGVIAKRLDVPYASGERKSMLKIKNLRTADCVVGGFRYGAKDKLVGSLLLGLYDDAGSLHHVGFTSGLSRSEKPDLTKKLEAIIQAPGFTGAAPGGPSRWSTERSVEWQPLAPKLVVEVQFDHFSGHRFRHGTKVLRWRPDKDPRTCLLSQVLKTAESPLTLLTSA